MTDITVLPGDGIGPAITDAAIKVLDALDCGFDYQYAKAGQSALDDGDDLIPQRTLDLIEQADATLKAPITTPVGKGFTSVNVQLRKHFNLYANVRPALSIKGVRSRFENVDIITVRENIEGIYSGFGQKVSEDGERAELTSVVTRTESKKLVRHAYDLARRQDRKKVTVVHKANIMKSTSGLFLNAAKEVGDDYPDIKHEELIVDNCAMQLVMRPENFDVIVTTNLFGDILSDLCAGLVGGLGVAPGANMGNNMGIFEPVHGSAPDIAGKNIANPTAILLASAMMLDYLEMRDKAEKLRQGVRDTINAKDSVTPDLGGDGTTDSFAEAVIKRL